jgi:hypothetical protein
MVIVIYQLMTVEANMDVDMNVASTFRTAFPGAEAATPPIARSARRQDGPELRFNLAPGFGVHFDAGDF